MRACMCARVENRCVCVHVCMLYLRTHARLRIVRVHVHARLWILSMHCVLDVSCERWVRRACWIMGVLSGACSSGGLQ